MERTSEPWTVRLKFLAPSTWTADLGPKDMAEAMARDPRVMAAAVRCIVKLGREEERPGEVVGERVYKVNNGFVFNSTIPYFALLSSDTLTSDS